MALTAKLMNMASVLDQIQKLSGQAGWKKDFSDTLKEFFKPSDTEKKSTLNDVKQTVEQPKTSEQVAQNDEKGSVENPEASEQLTPENDLVNNFANQDEALRSALKGQGKENDFDAYAQGLDEGAPQRIEWLKQYNQKTSSKKTPEELEKFEQDYRETQLDKKEKELDQTKDSLEENQKLTDLQKTNPELAEKVENGEYLNVDEAQQANSASAASTPETGTTGAGTGGTTGTGTATTEAGTGEAAASGAQAGAEAAEAGSEAAEAAELLLLAL